MSFSAKLCAQCRAGASVCGFHYGEFKTLLKPRSRFDSIRIDSLLFAPSLTRTCARAREQGERNNRSCDEIRKLIRLLFCVQNGPHSHSLLQITICVCISVHVPRCKLGDALATFCCIRNPLLQPDRSASSHRVISAPLLRFPLKLIVCNLLQSAHLLLLESSLRYPVAFCSRNEYKSLH